MGGDTAVEETGGVDRSATPIMTIDRASHRMLQALLDDLHDFVSK